MIKIKVAFLEGRLLSSQSEQFKKFSKSSDRLEKSHFCFDHVNKLKILRHEAGRMFDVRVSRVRGRSRGSGADLGEWG